ncbi:MAG TPA: hypothetical protein VIS06_06025 [Mycobacteriales bacterium]
MTVENTDTPPTAEQIIARAFTAWSDRPTPGTMRRANNAVTDLILAGLLANPDTPPPGTGMDDPVEIVMPRASWQRIAQAAQESSDRQTMVDGICLAETLDDDAPETLTTGDDFEQDTVATTCQPHGVDQPPALRAALADLARAAAHTMEQSRRMGQMFAHAAVESSDPATMAAGLTLADRVNDPGQDSVSDRDEYEDMPSGDLTEIMRAHALAGLASALEACGSVLDAAYRVEAIGRERGVDLFPARGYVTDFVADAMKCLRAARALAKEDSDA